MNSEFSRFCAVVKNLCARNQSFSHSAKVQLIYRGLSVSGLARLLDVNRASVSLVIHGRRKMPGVESKVRKALGL